MDLIGERMVPHGRFDGPIIKPWKLVTEAQALLMKDQHVTRALENGATHVWVRYIGYKLIISVYNLQDEGRRIPVDKAIEGKGIWFAQSRTGLYHCMPIKDALPPSLLQSIAIVPY